MVGSLEVDCDQVGPVGPNEVERVSDVTGYTWSLGGMETPGFLELTRIPDVIVPECVVKCVSSTSVMACVSACEELVHGPTQTGDGYSEPNVPPVSISGTAPVSRDVACEVHSAFSERPSRPRLRGGNPAQKRSTWDSTRPRGRLKWWRGLFEFGKQGSPCERVCEESRAARRVFRSRNAWSGFPG